MKKKVIKIFLSGGTRGKWQDQVKEYLSDISDLHFHDPRFFPTGTTMKDIAETERTWLDDSDLVFFYFEESNPSGIGSAFEIGYAVAHKLPILFVDGKRTSHTEWLAVHCTEAYFSLEEGLTGLRSKIKAIQGG